MVRGNDNTKHILKLEGDLKIIVHDNSKTSGIKVLNREFTAKKDNLYNFLYCYNFLDDISGECIPAFKRLSINDLNPWNTIDTQISTAPAVGIQMTLTRKIKHIWSFLKNFQFL